MKPYTSNQNFTSVSNLKPNTPRKLQYGWCADCVFFLLKPKLMDNNVLAL